ncbi:ATP-dependent helicase [Bacillus sp. CH_203]|uniref:ATP-dependent helicase n=1 Tax=Bacillus sp. CH_203 TaxID=2978216 RepID=UPI0030F6D0EA|nr:ATP-dependent helicase [Bacillus cereus]
MELTTEQKEAVMTVEGNVSCIASAGSGKTSSFVTRIAYMIRGRNIDPSNILAVTFTKKASEEMKKRLKKMIGKDKAERVPMGTFHSICYRLLKTLDKDFEKLKICPDWWRFGLINDICKEGNDKNPNGLNLGIKAGELASFISYQKSNGVEVSQPVIINEDVDYVDGVSRELLQEAYETYERVKEQSRQIDFDDMILYMYKKLKTSESFRQKLSDQYQYIMVDEYQDTAVIVKEIIKMINETNVFVVGDFRQSIYKFINAKVENILNFKDEFEDVKLIELNKNFRSTQTIVEFSNKIIANSPIEKYNEYKPSEAVAEVGEPVHFTAYQDEDIQIDRIADEVERLHEQGTPLKEIAILVRANSQTAIIEDIFAERDIPYEVSKSMSFFDRKEVLDILSYARVSVDENDDASFRRIYNTPNRYLSKKSLEELDGYASGREISLTSAVRFTPQNSDWKFKRNMDSLMGIISDLRHQVASNVNAGRVLRNIVNATRYRNHINETTTTASQIDEKLDAVERLCEMGAKFPNIKAFLAHIMTIKEKQKKAKGTDAVQVVTMHSSKGLEWDVVFVPNCNEDLMPHRMNNDIEEERRLFYVACSRPRKKLYVSYYIYDGEMEVQNEGLFITELLGEDKTTDMKKQLFRGNREVHTHYQIN